MSTRLSKGLAILLTLIFMLNNTVVSNATVTGNDSGTIDTSDDYISGGNVDWTFTSDGTLTLKGDGNTVINRTNSTMYGGDFAWNRSSKFSPSDVKTLIISRIKTLKGYYDVNFKSAFISTSSNIKTLILEDVEVIRESFSNLDGVSIILPDTIKELGYSAFRGNNTSKIKVVCPSTLELIDTNTLVGYSASNVTIVCEVGSLAYNWATTQGYNIEYLDKSVATPMSLSNSYSWGIITPEDISFNLTNEGWTSSTWVGITGNIPADKHVTVTVDKTAALVSNKDVQLVNLSTEDTSTIETDDSLSFKTILDTSKFEAGKQTLAEGIEGYKIQYNLKTVNRTLPRTNYLGSVKFLISEDSN